MRRAAVALLALALGCGSTRVAVVPLRARPLRPNRGLVRLYDEDRPLPERFREVALLQVEARGTDAEEVSAREALELRAAELGANAVVRVHIDRGLNVLWISGVAVREGEGPAAPVAADAGAQDASAEASETPAPWGTVPAP